MTLKSWLSPALILMPFVAKKHEPDALYFTISFRFKLALENPAQPSAFSVIMTARPSQKDVSCAGFF
jgi:hypothetical protein